jgi:hypothetical protein
LFKALPPEEQAIMANKIRRVEYFSLQIPDRPGEGARLLKALKRGNVGLRAFTGFPEGKGAQLDFFPEKASAFKRAANAMGLDIGKPKVGFLVQGKDRTGVVADILDKLAKAKINVTALDAASAGKRRYSAIFWVKPKDVAKAAKALGAG